MSTRYHLTFRGRYQPDATQEAAIVRLAALFKTSPERMAALLAQAPLILKKDLSPEEALRYQHALTAAGLITHLEPADRPLNPDWDGEERRQQDRRSGQDRRAGRRHHAIQPDRRQDNDRRSPRPAPERA